MVLAPPSRPAASARLAFATDLNQLDFRRGAEGFIPLAERGVEDPHHMCNAQLRQRGNKFFRREHVGFIFRTGMNCTQLGPWPWVVDGV